MKKEEKDPTIYDILVIANKDKHYDGKGLDTITDIKTEFDCTTADILKAITDNGKTIADFKITEKDIRESQIDDQTFKFEKKIIDPILNTISKHQVYLTKRANLPQLAKLGYMYNTLWYAGRVCWGSGGKLSKSKTSYDCENNTKDKIEMVNPKNERIENLVYDAWGMHVRDGHTEKATTFDDFKKIILEGRETTDFERRMLKVNKTFDEWVELLTNKQYKYHSLYKTRRSVADHLLCVIGNGYGMNKDGFIIQEASGADQDLSLYGDWQNAKFHPEIQAVVDQLLATPEVKQTIDTYAEVVDESIQKRKQEDNKHKTDWRNTIKRAFDGAEKLPKDSMFGDKAITDLTDDEIDEFIDILMQDRLSKNGSTKEQPYHPYYPISDYSIIHIMINKDSLKREKIKTVHQSYIDAGIEICKEILAHEKEENKERKGNVKFAKEFLAKVGAKGFEKYTPKEIDKDNVLRQIKKTFLGIKGKGIETLVNFSDKRKDKYASDTFFINIKFTAPRPELPMGFGNTVEYLKGTPVYSMLKSCISNATSIEEIKFIDFFYEKSPENIQIEISMHMDKERLQYEQDKKESEDAFLKDGFMVGRCTQALILDKMGLILITHKSEPLGS